MSMANAKNDAGFARNEHVVRVEVDSIDGGRGIILPKVIHWSHGEEYRIEYIVHWMRVHDEGSDIKLFKYMLIVLGRQAYLYREEHEDGTRSWYWGLF